VSIPLSTDIVAGVASAADSTKVRAATERLERIASVKESATARLANDSQATVATASRSAAVRVPLAKGGGKVGTTIGQTPSPLDEYQKFEAYVLQNFIELMMPKDVQSVYGGGVAGDYWKSLLAEKMAMEIARTGGVGVADTIKAPKNAAKNAAKAASPQTRRSFAPAPAALSYLPNLQSSDNRS
jgi:peptidoglycan hydrolase FlgJ